jgi:hypothetical protein
MTDQANKLSRVPVDPPLARSNSAVPPVCSAYAELFGMPDDELVEALVDEPVELLVPLDGEAADELEELEELDEGAVGWNVVFPVPKPTFDAKMPPTVTVSVLLLPAITSSPLLLSHAVTFALP